MIPLITMPRMKKRCARKKTTMSGSVISNEYARRNACIGKVPNPAAWNQVNPTASVSLLSLLR